MMEIQLHPYPKPIYEMSASLQAECEECKGSGICPACNGDGFLLKTPSKEAAARARATAKDAATRYTAG